MLQKFSDFSELTSNPKKSENLEKQNFDPQLIEMALSKSPTGGNSKSFSWLWMNSQTVRIQLDKTIRAHYLNPNHVAEWLALGCLIESADIAAQAQGFETDVRISKDLQCEMSFSVSQKTSDELFQALLKRRTSRFEFKTSAVPHVSQSAQPGIEVRLASALNAQTKFKNFVRSADQYIWRQSGATKSFFNEIRFFDRRLGPKGLRSEDLSGRIGDQIFLYILSLFPFLTGIIARTPLLNMIFLKASARNLKNAHFILITFQSLDPISLVRAGQESLRTWAELQKQGYQVQPYSTASLTLVDAETGHLPQDTSSFFRTLFTHTGPEIIKQQFKLLPQEKPVWLLRVGHKKDE